MKRTLRERKEDVSKAQEAVPRKRQAVRATCSAVTKSIIQKNASTSPLLRLPPEIRTQIFRLVIGDRFIHLLHTFNRISPGSRFRHCYCTADQSEDEAYRDFMNGYKTIPSTDREQYYVPSFRQRHAHCKHWDRESDRYFTDEERLQWRHASPGARPRNLLNLSLLQVCRQVYMEANFVFRSTVTFSFEDALTMQKFMSGRNAVQRKQLTAIHIDTQWTPEDLTAWAKLITPHFLKKFSGLRTLHVTYHQNTTGYFNAPLASMLQGDLDHDACDDAKAPVRSMRVLPLEHVTVIIADESRPQSSHLWNTQRWTVDEKRDVAELLRYKLLDPDGHKLTPEQIQGESSDARNLARMPEGKWLGRRMSEILEVCRKAEKEGKQY